jgi:hypothetical protein
MRVVLYVIAAEDGDGEGERLSSRYQRVRHVLIWRAALAMRRTTVCCDYHHG